MTDKLVVFVSCESRDEACAIAQAVVENKLAACVNVLPGVQSCYTWENRLTWSDEVLMIIKTTQARFSQLQKKILELHSYQVPEIVGVQIEEGSSKYLAWIDSSVA